MFCAFSGLLSPIGAWQTERAPGQLDAPSGSPGMCHPRTATTTYQARTWGPSTLRWVPRFPGLHAAALLLPRPSPPWAAPPPAQSRSSVELKHRPGEASASRWQVATWADQVTFRSLNCSRQGPLPASAGHWRGPLPASVGPFRLPLAPSCFRQCSSHSGPVPLQFRAENAGAGPETPGPLTPWQGLGASRSQWR